MYRYEHRCVVGNAFYYTILDNNKREVCIVLSDKSATSVKALLAVLNSTRGVK